MQPCDEFRARLAAQLSGRGSSPDWTTLAWHEHLHTCGECRDLLEAEEALEMLLATLPQPRLPRALCERVLERLATERRATERAEDRTAGDLDRLLDLAEVTPPGDLAGKVLRGLSESRRTAREVRDLDRLLDGVPAPVAPDDLAERVLDALEEHRGRRSALGAVPARDRGLWRSTPARWAAAAAILVSVALGLWRASTRPGEGERAPIEVARGDAWATQVAAREDVTDEAPPDELLASLDLLESWEFLMGEDVDQVLASLDTLDELVLYLDEEELGG